MYLGGNGFYWRVAFNDDLARGRWSCGGPRTACATGARAGE